MSEKLTAVELKAMADLIRRVGLIKQDRAPCADALEELAAIREQEEAKPEPESFRITKPGRYRQRDGGTAMVETEVPESSFPWCGRTSNCDYEVWTRDGFRSVSKEPYSADLIAYIGPLEEDDTALRDQCAIAVYAGLTVDAQYWGDDALPRMARDAFAAADAFMAERKVR